MRRLSGQHSRIDLITVLIAIWMAFSSPVTAEQLYYRTVSPGSMIVNDLEICVGNMESIIAGTGSLLPSNVPPPVLMDVLASPQVQFTVARIWFSNDVGDTSQYDGTLAPGDMELSSLLIDGFESGTTADWSTSIP